MRIRPSSRQARPPHFRSGAFGSITGCVAISTWITSCSGSRLCRPKTATHARNMLRTSSRAAGSRALGRGRPRASVLTKLMDGGNFSGRTGVPFASAEAVRVVAAAAPGAAPAARRGRGRTGGPGRRCPRPRRREDTGRVRRGGRGGRRPGRRGAGPAPPAGPGYGRSRRRGCGRGSWFVPWSEGLVDVSSNAAPAAALLPDQSGEGVVEAGPAGLVQGRGRGQDQKFVE